MSGSAYALEGLSPYAYGGVPQMEPQGRIGNIAGSLLGPVGGVVAGPVGGVVGGILGRGLASIFPWSAPGPQLAPQGAIGDMIGAVGNPLAQHLGGMLHQPQLGQAIGNLLSTVGPMFPFAAAGPQLAPQGAIGNLVGQLGGPLAGALGGLLHQPQLGQTIGNLLSTLGPMAPFAAAGPQLAPQGAIGNLLGGYGGLYGGQHGCGPTGSLGSGSYNYTMPGHSSSYSYGPWGSVQAHLSPTH